MASVWAMFISRISHVAICRNGNNGPGDSAGRCSFLCPVCLRKVWLALSFTPSGPTNSVLSRYQVSCRCASIVTFDISISFRPMTRMKNWHMMTKLWIPNEAILQLMQALAVKFKEMEVLDEMTELLGDIDWLEILGLQRFVLRIRLCNLLLTCVTFCARKRMTSLGWASKTGASWCIWSLHPELVTRSAASFVKLFQQFLPCSKHTYEHGMPLSACHMQADGLATLTIHVLQNCTAV